MIFKSTILNIRPQLDNVFWWIRHYSGSQIYFTLNVVQGFRTLPNLAVHVHCTQANIENFAPIETVE